MDSIPRDYFRAFENLTCVGFPSVGGYLIKRIDSIVPHAEDDVETGLYILGCQLEDRRWINVLWDSNEDASDAFPAYYSYLWDKVVSIDADRIRHELHEISADLAHDIKKQVEQWLPYLDDEAHRDEIQEAIGADTK